MPRTNAGFLATDPEADGSGAIDDSRGRPLHKLIPMIDAIYIIVIKVQMG